MVANLRMSCCIATLGLIPELVEDYIAVRLHSKEVRCSNINLQSL